MNPSVSRTLVALVLTVALVAVPYGAWMISGLTNLSRQQEHDRETVTRQARDETAHLARDLSLYLEQLRKAEGTRPFNHYLSQLDERGVIAPPLAVGSSNPIIMVHYLITESGHVAVPAPVEAPLSEMLQATAQPVLDYLNSQRPPAPASEMRRISVTAETWRQTLETNRQYLKLDSTTIQSTTSDVQLAIEPFIWQTIGVSQRPVLTALRCVTWADGKWVQGFAISPESALQWVSGRRRSNLPLQITVGRPPRDAIAAPFMGESWWLRADVSKLLAELHEQVAESRRTFIIEFSASALAAAIAGAAVIGLVWQSERLARQRSRFAASAAHELRTPLAGLRMYGEMLSEGLGDPENTRAYAHRITDEAQRLGRVVNNVLGFARLERGALAVRMETGDLGAAVTACIERHRLELEKAGITLDVQVDDNLPRVRFDHDAVAQIMQNLLDNAEKYSRTAEDRTIHVRVANVSGGVAVTVRDHGPGIDGRVRRHLFQPFARARNRDAPAGIGLGLTITRALVRAHRGRIEVDNAAPPLGPGAVFTVTFRAS